MLMRKRNLIPTKYKNWLDAYLERKGIHNYPELDSKQWSTLQGAYRQMLLKAKSVTNALNHPELLESQKLTDKFRQKYDDDHRKVISLQSSNNLLRHDLQQLKNELESLKNKTYSCQCIISKGTRCERKGNLKVNWQGIEIRVCLQHSKAMVNK